MSKVFCSPDEGRLAAVGAAGDLCDLTGGAFGPEAGLVLLPALVLGALLIRLYPTRKTSD